MQGVRLTVQCSVSQMSLPIDQVHWKQVSSHLFPGKTMAKHMKLHPREEKYKAQVEGEANGPLGLAFPESNPGLSLFLSCL